LPFLEIERDREIFSGGSLRLRDKEQVAIESRFQREDVCHPCSKICEGVENISVPGNQFTMAANEFQAASGVTRCDIGESGLNGNGYSHGLASRNLLRTAI
jgi:hypothetical protein